MPMQVSNEKVLVAEGSSSCLDEEGDEVMHSKVKLERATGRASRSLDIELF